MKTGLLILAVLGLIGTVIGAWASIAISWNVLELANLTLHIHPFTMSGTELLLGAILVVVIAYASARLYYLVRG